MNIRNSYGIIPFYKQGDDIFICAIQNKKSGEWGLPKGSPEKGETPIVTAVRELDEETGITEFQIIEEKTLTEKYSFEQDGVTYQKENTYWLGRVPQMNEKPSEIDARDMKWINAN
jgi:bis(5'-nucleosidyl)-tetraphosphatase